MKNCIIKISFFFFLVKSFILQAQTDDLNHRKYWVTKSRLNNNFVKVGPDAGESIPFNQRGLYAKVDENETIIPSNILKIGDEGSTVGMYIAVLATEYALLQKAGQNTDNTKKELFYALHAINRMDMFDGNLNGCIVRGDHPVGFLKNKTNYQHFNFFSNWDNVNNKPLSPTSDRGFMSPFLKNGMTLFDGGLVSDKEVLKNVKYSGIDHFVSILYGLGLVVKLVDSNANFDNQSFAWDGAVGLKQEAMNIADRIVNFIHKDNWWLRNPDGTKMSKHDGGNAYAWAYPFAESHCIVAKDNSSQAAGIGMGVFLIPKSCNVHHDFWTQTGGYMAWQPVAKAPGLVPLVNHVWDIPTQQAELSATCNCIYTKNGGYWTTTVTQVLTKINKWLGLFFGWYWELVNQIINVFVPGVIDNTTNTDMMANVNKYSLEHTAYARKLMHPNDGALINTQTLTGSLKPLLDKFPCEGAVNLSYKLINKVFTKEYEWSSPTRLEHPENRFVPWETDTKKIKNWVSDFTGEYNGLDYMLYHNLWYLYDNKYNGNSNGGTQDLSKRFISKTLPQGNQNQSIGAFEFLIANNIVNGGTITYRAGKEIEFKNGFSVSGSNFSAYIDEFKDCSDWQGNQWSFDESTPIRSAQRIAENVPLNKYQDDDAKNLLTSSEFIHQVLNQKFYKSNIRVYPIPSIGEINIELPFKGIDSKENLYLITISDLSGNEVKSFNGLATGSAIKIDLTDLKNGIYFIKIKSFDDKEFVKQFILNSK